MHTPTHDDHVASLPRLPLKAARGGDLQARLGLLLWLSLGALVLVLSAI